MACKQRKALVFIGLVSLGSLFVCVFLMSRLPVELEADDGAGWRLEPVNGAAREMNGKRDILNIEQNEPVVVATVDMEKDESKQEAGEMTHPLIVDKLERSKCDGPWPPGYPNCAAKMEWMQANWKIDECYSRNGVDGSMCSFQRYLSTVEKWCPPLKAVGRETPGMKAIIQPVFQPLLERMSGNSKFDWISRRIQSRWAKWAAALNRLEMIKPFNHSAKVLLIHIGALTDKAGFKFAENADRGGPLGELVQWSDLIATLYMLGHTLDFSTEVNQLSNYLELSSNFGGCPTSSETRYDAIYIDIAGLKQFKKLVKNRIQHYQCLFHVLDTFGTEPQFNFKQWKPTKKEYGRIWGNWELNPRQFMTMYPHTPDNSFLGFVVGSNTSQTLSPFPKKSIGLVYGKELYMWENKRQYLDVLSRYLDIHATIGTTEQKNQQFDSSIIPGFVINHGILNSSSLERLLEETKVFIGLGFPYEGPAPLEAIAKGCYYLNPVLNPPLNRDNNKFFKSKPTLRALTSQNSYAEEFIGEPYVFTVNIDNLQSVKAVMEVISNNPSPPPYIPYEFTYEGMLERVAIYLENQEFCVPHKWPPQSELITRISDEGDNCKDTCHKKGMVCEPEFFPLLNKQEALEKNGFTCSNSITEHSVHGPSYTAQKSTCSLQQNDLLLSCVGSEVGVQRLCPCRIYGKGQVALCVSCTR